MSGFGIAGIGGGESGRLLEKDDFVVGLAVNVETGDAAGDGVGTVGFQAEDLRIVAGRMADLGGFKNAPGIDPVLRSGEIGVEGRIDADLRPAGLAAGVVHEDDVLFQEGVPVNGRTPMGVRVRLLPGDGGGEDGGHVTAATGLFPGAVMEFLDGGTGLETVGEWHTGDRDALLVESAAVVSKKEIEEVAITVGDDGKIAVTAGEEAVFGVAIDRVTGFEYEPKILDRFSVVVGDGGADAGGSEIVAFADATRFIVIPEKERSVFIAPDGLKPDRFMFGRVEINAFSVGEAELIPALATSGDAGGVEDVEFTVGPHGGGVTVDDFGKFDFGGGLNDGVLTVTGKRE